jgi:hypothetical protein
MRFTEASIRAKMAALGDIIFDGQAAAAMCYTCHRPERVRNVLHWRTWTMHDSHKGHRAHHALSTPPANKHGGDDLNNHGAPGRHAA